MFPLTQKIIKYNNEEFNLFLNERSIQEKVSEIANEINEFYKELLKNDKDEDVTALCILKGGLFYFTDLVKKLKFYVRPQFLYDKRVFNYVEGQEKIEIKDIKNKHVLVVMNFINNIENISQIYGLLNNLGAKSINFTVLIRGSSEELKVACKWIGFSYQFPTEMIGYGFDKNEYFRPLNQIYKKNENYEETLHIEKDQNPEEI